MGQGTGLGLSVVEGIIDQSKVEMWVSSQPGRGTTFALALALVEAQESTREADMVGSGGQEMVLVVENEEAVQGVLVRGLQRKGYCVLQAADAAGSLRGRLQLVDAGGES